jgi:predicted neuraminidase
VFVAQRVLFAALCLLLPMVVSAQSSARSAPADWQRTYAADIGHPLDGLMRAVGTSAVREAWLAPIFPSSHASSLLSLRDGDLLCFWFSGTWEGESGVGIVMSRLRAGSPQWTTPVLLDRLPGESYQNPVGFQAPDGTIWLLHTTQPAGKGEAQSRVLVLRSTDNGESWSKPTVLMDTPGSFIRNPMLIMPNGDWMLPMYYSTAGSSVTVNDHPSIAISADHGKTWKRCDIPDASEYVQPSVTFDPAHGYAALLRSRRADHIYRSTSQDGCHWSAPVATDLPNNNAAIQTLRLEDGTILLAFNNTSAHVVNGKRQTGPRKPLSLALSTDNGLTWHGIRDIETGRPDATDTSKSPGREEYSYPALAQGRDGRIYLSYTFRRQTIKVVSFPQSWLGAARRD